MPSSVMPTSRQGDGHPSPTAVSAVGLRKSYGDKTVLDGIDLHIPAGSVFALLGPNGAGKTTAVKILSTLITADAGRPQVAGHDLATDPQAVRAAIGVTGQFSAVDGLITGEENMLLMADLHHLSKQRGAAGRRRTPGALRPGGGREEARLDLLRRHEAPPRPRDDAGRQPADHLPRRADHRPRPALPPQHVGHHPRARLRRRDRLPHHPVPGGGRRTRRPHRGVERRQDRRRGHRRGAQAAHPRRARPAPLHRPGRVPVRRRRPARGHPGRRGTVAVRSPATAASANCAPSSTGWTPPASRRTN